MTDKFLHYFAGLGTAGAVYFFVHNSLIALSAGVLAGVGKEVYDYLHPESHSAEWLDLLATTLGALTIYLAVTYGS